MSAAFAGSLTQQVIDSLGLRIVRNEFVEGEITTAGSLQERYGVSRTVIREACQVLQSKGMMQARTKTGTVILPRSEWNLLDPELIGWYKQVGAGPELVRDLEEVRASYEPWAVFMAAQRRTDEDLEAIRSAYEGMLAAVEAEGAASPDLVQADLEFHQATFQASHNLIMIHLGLVVRPLLQIRDEMAMRHDTPTDFLEMHRAVLDAIKNQQPDSAANAMRDLLERSARDSAQVMTESDKPAGPTVAFRYVATGNRGSDRTS